MTPQTFWPEALPWAQQAHAQTGVLTSVILAQWAIETEYGGTDWAVAHNPGNVGSFNGQPVASFPTLAEGVAAYIQLMNAPDRPEFGATIRKNPSYATQAYLLGAANPVWATSRYALPGGKPGSEIVSIIASNNLTQYDGTPAPTPAPTPIPTPTTEDPMNPAISEDGTVLAAIRSDGHLVVFSAPGGNYANASITDLTDRGQATDAAGGPWTFPTT